MRIRTLLVCLLLASVVVSWSLFLRDEPAVPDVVTNGPDAALAAALAQPARLDADGETLAEVLIELEKAYGIDVVVDRTALADAQLDHVLSADVHCHVSNISLGSLIRVLLRRIDPDLATIPRGSRITLTTIDEADGQSQLVGHVYRLPPELLGPNGTDEEAMVDLIAWCCRPESWEDVGGFGVVQVLPGALAVIHRQDVHDEIADLLDKLPRMQAVPPDVPPVYAGRAGHANCDKIRRALEKATAAQFDDVALRTALSRLGSRHGVPIFIDGPALEAVGIDADARVSVNLWEVRLESALNRILEPLDLTWCIRDEVLWITTVDRAEEDPVMRLYPVGDLLAAWTGIDNDALYETIEGMVAPLTWDDVGGTGALEFCGNVMVVTQTDDVHASVERLLGDLRRQLDPSLPDPPPTVADTLRAELERALEAPAYLRCKDKPIRQVLEWLRDQHGIDIREDRGEAAVGFEALNATVTCDMAEEPLRRVLAAALEPLELQAVIRDDVVLVTTAEGAQEQLEIRVYDVRHLLDPNLDLPRDDGGLDDASSSEYPSYPDYDTLIESITWLVAPNTWDEVGGPGSICGIAGGLLIAQTDDVHRRIETLLAGLTQLQDEPDRQAPIEAETRENRIPPAIAEALDTPISLDCKGTTLQEVVDQLSAQVGVEIRLQGTFTRLTEDWEYTGDSWPIACRFDGVPLHTVLESLCLDWRTELAYYVQDREIRLLPRDMLEPDRSGYVRIYPLAGFPPDDPGAALMDPRDPTTWDYSPSFSESLVDAAYECIEPDSWDQVGGPGSVELFAGPLGSGLIVSNDYGVHRQVESCLEQLRGPLPPEEGPGRLLAESPARRRIERILAEPADEPLTGLTPRRAIERLAERYELNIVLDEGVLMPLAVQPAGRTLEEVLLSLVGSFGPEKPVGIAVRGDVVLLSTSEGSRDRDSYESRLYNVRGLRDRFSKVTSPWMDADGNGNNWWAYSNYRSTAFCWNAEFTDLARLFTHPTSDRDGPGDVEATVVGVVLIVAGPRDAHRRLDRFLCTVRQALPELPSPNDPAVARTAGEIERLQRLLEPGRPAAVKACAVFLIAGSDDPPDELIDPIVALLSPADSIESQRLRPLVFFALRKFGPDASQAVEAVAAQWRFLETRMQRWRLVATLGNLGPDAVEPLIAMLKDPDVLIPHGTRDERSKARHEIHSAVGNLGEDAAAAIPTLLEEIVFDANADRALLETLERIDPSTEKIREFVAELMNDPDTERRERGFKLHEYVRTHFGDPMP